MKCEPNLEWDISTRLCNPVILYVLNDNGIVSDAGTQHEILGVGDSS